MPMDIRAYFSKTPESKPSPKPSLNGSNKSSKSRKRVFIDSDSDDETPKKSKSTENAKSALKKPKSEGSKDTKSKYFEVSKNDVASLLGKGPIKRVKQSKTSKKEKETEVIEDIDWDDDFPIAQTSQSNEPNKPTVVTPDSKSGQSPNKIKPSKESPKTSSIEVSPHKSSPPTSPTQTSSKKDISPKKKLIDKELPSEKDKSPKHLNPPLILSKDHDMSPSPEREPDPHTVSPPVKKSSPDQKDCKIPLKKEEASQPSLKNLDINTSTTVKEPSFKKLKSNEGHSSKISQKSLPQSSPKKEVDDSEKLWVEKYKPANLKQIIGQQGEKSNVGKLVRWLKDWFINRGKKIPRPSPWAKNDDGGFYRAALLSGPPGVGKTTTAHLVCKELGMDMVEFNASDTRSKRLLKEEISDLLKSKSLSGFVIGGEMGVSRQHVLVMDEVDGMAGNEDRGGVQELIQLIRTTRVPVICMCNDRNHPKIRSLANYCFDLRFSKPRAEQIKGAMMSVCFKEGLKIKPDVLNDIIVNTNQDIRLILNHLSMMAAQQTLNLPVTSKYVKLGPWDVIRKVFSESEHKNMTIYDKCDLFFFDYNIAPLFVQENYLNVQPHSEESKTKHGKMKLFAKAAQSIAYGDLVERAIRSNNAWGLLPVQAVFSSYMPGEQLVGHMGGQIAFPAWLGKNSRRGKLDRLAQEIQAHTRLRTSGSKEAICLDYSGALKERIVRPLTDRGTEGIEEALTTLREYSLLREDLDSLVELTAWPGSSDPFAKLESKTKAAFTRAYNKNPVVTPFSLGAAVKKGRGGGAGGGEGGQPEDIGYGEEGDLEEADLEEEEEGENDDLTKDGMIMVKKKSSKEDSKKADQSAGGSKRGGGSGRGGAGRGKRGKK